MAYAPPSGTAIVADFAKAYTAPSGTAIVVDFATSEGEGTSQAPLVVTLERGFGRGASRGYRRAG